MKTTSLDVRELIQNLPDPQAAAAEMVRRGWITQSQFSSLFPDPQQRPAQETMPAGRGGDESPPGTNCDDWSLTVGDDKDKAERARPDRTDELVPAEPEAALVPTGPANTPQNKWVLVPTPASGNDAGRRESSADQLPGLWLGWASKRLLVWPLILGSFIAGLRLFQASSSVPLEVPQQSRLANAGDPARSQLAFTIAKQFDDVRNKLGQNRQPAAPVAAPPAVAPPVAVRPVPVRPVPVPPAVADRPFAPALPSLYARVRQVVLENKTEETQRLGIGDFAYQDVPTDGSIMVGMAVTYAPFFNHQIIKSVQATYQKQDGTRYDGPICGSPTRIGERVVAKEGYAIGAAAIRAGMGIDGMQLTFMEIGADGLNTSKSYLSKWLGGYGGADARTYINDGRPVVGIAGMRSGNANSPAFCLGLVTTRPGALEQAYSQETMLTPDRANVPGNYPGGQQQITPLQR